MNECDCHTADSLAKIEYPYSPMKQNAFRRGFLNSESEANPFELEYLWKAYEKGKLARREKGLLVPDDSLTARIREGLRERVR